jgi:hypothetical protein
MGENISLLSLLGCKLSLRYKVLKRVVVSVDLDFKA